MHGWQFICDHDAKKIMHNTIIFFFQYRDTVYGTKLYDYDPEIVSANVNFLIFNFWILTKEKLIMVLEFKAFIDFT